jgi:RimJ/RimL family protein N-acetyltransferase
VARRAVRILLDVAFTMYGLDRVYAECYSFNPRAHALFERVGFVREGILRQHEVHAGERRDMHVFGILKTEFRDKYPPLWPAPR